MEITCGYYSIEVSAMLHAKWEQVWAEGSPVSPQRFTRNSEPKSNTQNQIKQKTKQQIHQPDTKYIKEKIEKFKI